MMMTLDATNHRCEPAMDWPRPSGVNTPWAGRGS